MTNDTGSDMTRSTSQARLRDYNGYYATVRRTRSGGYRAIDSRGYATEEYGSLNALSNALLIYALYDHDTPGIAWSDDQSFDVGEINEAGSFQPDPETTGIDDPQIMEPPSQSYDSDSGYDSSGSSYDSGGSGYDSSGSSYDSGGSDFGGGGDF